MKNLPFFVSAIRSNPKLFEYTDRARHPKAGPPVYNYCHSSTNERTNILSFWSQGNNASLALVDVGFHTEGPKGHIHGGCIMYESS